MGDLASDHDSAIELIIGEYRRLYSHNPNHELLKYICDVSDDSFRYSPDKKIRQKFVDAYAPDERTPVAVMLAKYFVALRDAVDRIEGIDRFPKPKQPVNIAPIKILDDIDDLPF